MKTFKQFINESNFSRQRLTVDAALFYAASQCGDYLKACEGSTLKIFRGDNNSNDAFSMGDSSNFVRTSANTHSWYALWIDNSPAWKKFPKRLSSYICASSVDATADYGDINIIIPHDSAKIGVVPASDIWVGFSKKLSKLYTGFDTVADFQHTILTISQLIFPEGTSFSDSNYSLLKSQFESATIEVIETALNESQSGHMTAYTKASITAMIERMRPSKLNLKNLAELYDYVFDPANFESISPSEAKKIKDDREIWVGGECLFINIYALDEEEIQKVESFFSDRRIDTGVSFDDVDF